MAASMSKITHRHSRFFVGSDLPMLTLGFFTMISRTLSRYGRTCRAAIPQSVVMLPPDISTIAIEGLVFSLAAEPTAPQADSILTTSHEQAPQIAPQIVALGHAGMTTVVRGSVSMPA